MIFFKIPSIRALLFQYLFRSTILFAVVLPTFLFAQIQNSDWEIKIYGVPDGISHRQVQDILTDSKGFLWIATRTGLERYDGYNFLHFNNDTIQNGSLKIKGSNIEKISLLGESHLLLKFVGTKDSVEILNTDTFESRILKFETNSEGITGISDILSTESGQIYALRTELNDLSILEIKPNGVLEELFTVSENTDSTCFDLEKNKLIKSIDGRFFIYRFCTGALFTISPEGVLKRDIHDFFKEVSIPKKPIVNFFIQIKNGESYISFENLGGIFYTKLGTQNFKKHPKFDTNFKYTSHKRDRSGNVFITSMKDFYSRKLYLLDSLGNVFDKEKILDVQPKIISFFGDNFKNDFFIGSHVGLYRFSSFGRKGLRTFLHDPNVGLDFGKIMRGIVGNGNGKIYIAEEQSTWYELDNSTWEIKRLPPLDERGLEFDTLNGGTNLIHDKNGLIWGTSYDIERRGRIHAYNPKSNSWKVWRMGIPGDYPRLQFIDSKENHWVITIKKGENSGFIYRLDAEPGIFTQYKNKTDQSNPLANHNPFYMTELSNGLLAIGTNRGLVLFDPENNSSEFVADFPGKEVYSIIERSPGILWIGTLKKGIYIFDLEKRTFETITKEAGIADTEVYSMLPMNDSIWMIGTANGLTKYNLNSRTGRSYYREDGLPNNEFNRFSCFKDEKNNLILGGINGLSVFEGDQFFSPDPVPKTQFTRFFKYSEKLNKEENFFHFNENATLTIQPSDLYFGFDYMLPDFKKPEKNQFITWLEGFEKEPRQATTQNNIRYDKLPAGDYTLNIVGLDNGGNKSKELLSVKIRVQEVFYKTGWFWFLMFCLLMAMIGLIYNFQIRTLKNKQAEESRIKSKMANLELQALRSQLNPHFIFNCMGTIEYFIHQNEPEIAGKYLAKFGQLMRMFLESSRNRYISLEEELEMLGIYIDLEKMRFSNKFSEQIFVDPIIDPSDTFIPSILIQPFVENAIKHGLFHKKEEGLLLIKFEKRNESIQCVIEDNGIGRKKAEKMKQNSIKKHKSRGMEIINDRVEVIRKTDEFSINYEIIDLTNQAGKAIGTRVVLQIPLID